MFRLLRADEIECRISSVSAYGVQLLLYKDARCDMNILDETVGMSRWQRKHELINGNLFCSVGIQTEAGEWVWKQDVGTESYTEKEKGQASDSFKRACFNWGIGRELYTAPSMYVNARDLATLKKDDKGKYTCRDYFTVTGITYDGRKIATVTIENAKTGAGHMFGTPAAEQKKQADIKASPIGAVKAKALEKLLTDAGQDVKKFADYYKVESLEQLTEAAFAQVVRGLQQRADAGKT